MQVIPINGAIMIDGSYGLGILAQREMGNRNGLGRLSSK